MRKISYTEDSCEFCNVRYVPTSSKQRWCLTCVPDRKARQIMIRYRMSAPAYREFVRKYKGVCVLCTNVAKCIDHSHRTGKVRGLLCVSCNTALNRVEIPGWTEKAHKYLVESGG